MLEWEARLSNTYVSDVPPNLRKPQEVCSRCGIKVPDPHTPVESKWQPLPRKKCLPERPAPQGWLSAGLPRFRSSARDKVQAFKKKMTLSLAGECERPHAVGIPGSWLQCWEFEALHEFHSKPGWAVPIDKSITPPSHVNLNFYSEMGSGYPDQEIISFILLGVRYKADLQVQIVLLPHLMSLLPVQAKYLEETDCFATRG